MWEIKMKPGLTNNIQKLFEQQEDFNKYIDKNVKDPTKWEIFANSRYFKFDRIDKYRDIPIHYNDFLLTDNIVVLAQSRNA